MPKTHVITAIDIGTEKVSVVIASKSDQDVLQVVGIASAPSKGMKKSQIVDLEDAIESISKAVDGAERMAGFGVSSAYVAISGAHISSQNSKGVVAVANPDAEITPSDVARVIEAARAISLPSAREIIHVIPREFKVDSQDGIKDPVGMSGVRLEAEAHIITGSATALRNVAKCLSEIGITVTSFVFSGVASSLSVLTETEKELGVVLLDIGAGSTALASYVDGALAYSCVLPIGARHITQDIALGSHISLQAAEKVKLALTAMPSESATIPGESREQARDRKKREDEMDMRALGVDEIDTLSRKTLIEGIMVPRMKEMFEMVGKELEKEKLFPLVPAGIVITGGGALTVGMADVCKRTLSLATRVGVPTGVRGLIDDVETPQFASTMGLILYGSKVGGEEVKSASGNFALPNLSSFQPSAFSSMGKKLVSLFRSLLP